MITAPIPQRQYGDPHTISGGTITSNGLVAITVVYRVVWTRVRIDEPVLAPDAPDTLHCDPSVADNPAGRPCEKVNAVQKALGAQHGLAV